MNATAQREEGARQSALDDYAILDTPAEPAFDDIVRLACMVCDAPAAAIGFVDRDRQWFKAREGITVPQTPRAGSICDVAIRSPRRTLVVRDALDAADIAVRLADAGGEPLRFQAGAPLRSPDGHALGALCVFDRMPRKLEAAQQSGLEALARQVGHLLELRKLERRQRELLQQRSEATQRLEHERADLQRRHDDLQREARHDPLTGLLNRNALERLRANPEAMRRLDAAGYALAVIDIDHFKQVNDRHGHLLGDRALRAVAQAVSGCIRQGDLAVRFGGEEFLVVLPSTPLAGAFEVAERMREAVMRAELPFAVTVSIGVAAGDPRRDRPEQVFERADQALYRAKAGGRNRVVADDTPRV